MTGTTITAVIVLLLTSLVLEHGETHLSPDRRAGRNQVPEVNIPALSNPTARVEMAADGPRSIASPHRERSSQQ
jgi:hypothetical protein